MSKFLGWFFQGGVAGVAKRVGIAILALFVLCMFLGSWVVVPKEHVGVSNYLGKVSKTPVLPGPHLKFPLIEKIDNVQISEQTYPGTLDAFSSDLQDIKVQYTARVRLSPSQVPILYTEYAGDTAIDWYAKQVQPEINQTVKEITARYRLQDMAIKRDAIRAEIYDRIHSRIKTMEISGFTLDNLDPSAKLKESIEKKVVAEQEMLAEDYHTSASEKVKQQTINKAQGEAEAIRLKAEALKANQGAILLDMIQKWDGNAPTTLVINGSLSNSVAAEATSAPVPIILNTK